MAEDDDEGEEEPLACHKLAKQIAVAGLLINEPTSDERLILWSTSTFHGQHYYHIERLREHIKCGFQHFKTDAPRPTALIEVQKTTGVFAGINRA